MDKISEVKFNINAGIFVAQLSPVFNVAMKNFNNDFDNRERITLKISEDNIQAISHGGTASVISTISNDNTTNLNYSCETPGTITVRADDLIKSFKRFILEKSVVATTLLEGNEFVVHVPSDKKQQQTMFLITEEVKPPFISPSFQKNIIMNRETFVKGMNKVHFAIGYAQTMQYYLCQLLEVTQNSARFVAGTGSRFAICDIKGKNVVSNQKTEEFILFPYHNIKNLIEILSNASDQEITIKRADAQTDDSNNPTQIIVEFDNSMLVLLGIDETFDEYKPIDSILNFDYPYVVSTKHKDWEPMMVGIDATISQEVKDENDIHNTDVSLNIEQESLWLNTRSPMKAGIKIPCEIKNKNGDGGDPLFRCSSQWLLEMVKKGEKGHEFTIEFEDKPADEKKKARPVVVRFPEIPNPTIENKEKFTLFFTTSNR